MVADWYEGFVLESEWTRGDDPQSGRYRLILTNNTKTALEGFRLGISGPARVSDNAEVTGGRVVTHLSNFCELAPPAGFSLRPGASWTVDVLKLDYPIRHWTDGATTAFVIRADGSTASARHSAAAPKRRRVLAWPVRPKGRVGIMRRRYRFRPRT